MNTMENSSPGVKLSAFWTRDLSILRSQVPKQILVGLAVCATYILAGKLSLHLAIVHPSASPVWPPTGIAIAALLMLGSRFWPAVFAGAFERTWDILRFALCAGILSTAVAATFGVTSLALGGFASWNKFSLIWRTWWLGDAAGALMFTPLLLLWGAKLSLNWTKRQFLEAGVLLVSLTITAGIVFGVLLHARVSGDPWTFLCTPFLVWTAFRFGQRESSAAICLLSAIAVVGTVHGRGPFVRETPNDSLLLLQSFLGVMALMTLIFGAEASERRLQEEHARVLAVSDPLTGLANYRLLLDRLDSEIKRYLREGRSFSVILLDLDGLKKINDAHGHIVGSLALCRMAEVLLLSCRAIDTPARYGGDEFALVLPGTSSEDARRVAQRISQRLSEDVEVPRLS